MLKFALSHFLHQRKAKSRHGLHSPFVYRLVDKVIYDFSNKKVYSEIEKTLSNLKKLNKTDKLLYRLVADTRPQTVWLAGKVNPVDEAIIGHAAATVPLKNVDNQTNWKDSTPPDVAYIDARLNPQLAMDYFNRVLPTVHGGTLLIVNNIHTNALTQNTWNAMRSHGKVTASVNLFWLGLLYFREGQVKEDFLIKF